MPTTINSGVALVGSAKGNQALALLLTSERLARDLPGRLALFRDATSLGGVESLIEWRRKYDDAVDPRLVRLSVGLEEPEHLLADLTRGIQELAAEQGMR